MEPTVPFASRLPSKSAAHRDKRRDWNVSEQDRVDSDRLVRPAPGQMGVLNTLHPINLTSGTLHHKPYTLHPAPYTLHPTPYTLHPWGSTPTPTRASGAVLGALTLAVKALARFNYSQIASFPIDACLSGRVPASIARGGRLGSTGVPRS